MKVFLGFLFLISFSLLLSLSLSAHEGPAYPILVDHNFHQAKLSIWADPDTGAGTFSIYIAGEKSPNLNDYQIEVSATPTNDPSHRLTKLAILVEKNDQQSTYKVVLPFDRELMWNVEFHFKQNNLTIADVTEKVEVTPPGPNKWEFALYFLPFLLLGFIWLRVVIYKRKPEH